MHIIAPKCQLMYLLQCFSLFRTQVSNSSAHVSDQRMQN